LLLVLWRRPGPILTTAAVTAFSFWAQNHAIIANAMVESPNVHYVGFLQKSGHHLHRLLARLQQVNLHYVGLFTLGMLAASAAFTPTGPLTCLRKPWALRTLAAVSVLSAATMVVMLGSMSIVNGVSHLLIADFLAGIATCTLMMTACHLPYHPARGFLSMRPVVWLGTFSYSLYLIHAPLLQVIWQYIIHPLGLRPGPTFLLLALVSAPLIPACAYAFFLFCERPFMNHPPKVTSPA
jgi:peptidoglycan/LPS O-acetylase OafA/YrhL